ncbi:14118_t:CDS:2, partial [Ambispora leptoticha]
ELNELKEKNRKELTETEQKLADDKQKAQEELDRLIKDRENAAKKAEADKIERDKTSQLEAKRQEVEEVKKCTDDGSGQPVFVPFRSLGNGYMSMSTIGNIFNLMETQPPRISKSDLKSFLVQDHTSFSVLSVSTKHIESTNRISVTLSKNSAQSFYLGQKKTKSISETKPVKPKDDCLKDAQNCTYFAFFNSKEKKLYTRFKDKVEANFEGTQADQPSLKKTPPSCLTLINAPSIKTSPPVEIAEPTSLLYDLMVEWKAVHQPALLIGKHKLDAQTGQHLPKNQKVFRHYDYQTQQTTYFYKTNEQLVGQVHKPFLDKKHFRLGTRSLNPLNLLTLFTKSTKKEVYQAKKPKGQLNQDFQEFLITRFLLLCSKAEFLHTPLEQEHVPKEVEKCSQSIYQHFQVKPVLHFQFTPKNAPVVRSFIANLDTYAQEYDMEESQDFYAYPITHDAKHEITKQLTGLCG